MSEELLEGRKLQRLQELIYSKVSVTEGQDGEPITIEGIASIADEINANNRVYPTEVLTEAVKQVVENLDRHPGLVDHPEGDPSVADVGIRYTDLWMDGKYLRFKGEIVPTQRGLDLAAVCKSGIEVGISTRGWGESKRGKWNGVDGVSIIQPGYQMDAPDAVLQPSVEDARITQIESDGEVDYEALTITGLKTNRPDLIEALGLESSNMEDNKETPRVEDVKTEEAPVVEEKETVQEDAPVTEDAPIAENVEFNEVKTSLQEATAKIEELNNRLSALEEAKVALESEKQELSEGIENIRTMIAACSDEVQELAGNKDFYGAANMSWMGADMVWMHNRYARDMMPGLENVAKSAAENAIALNLHRFVGEKCRGEKYGWALATALADCKSVEDVESRFEDTKKQIEAEMAGLPRVETKGQVIEPAEEKKNIPSDVAQAIEAMSRFGK